MRVTTVLIASTMTSCAARIAEHDGKAGHAGHHAPGGMQHDFHDVDHWVSVFEAPGRADWQKPDEIVALMTLTEGSVVADIGAGTGYFLPWLVPAVGATGKVLALDVEKNLVAYMNDRIQREGWTTAEARLIGFSDPALPDGSVDRILIVDTWHHIEGREAYAKRLAAALRPGGAVVIVDFTMESNSGPAKEHRVSAAQASAELASAGLAPVTAAETLPDQYIVIATKR